MTQRNIDIMDLIVDKMAEGKTIARALKEVYVKRNVVIPFDEENLNVGVNNLGMSRKTVHALMRGRMLTLADVVKYCEKQKITTVRLLGISAGIETFEAMLNYLWSKMSTKERTEFLIDTIQRNEQNLREELM
jgi:hypothetical protein